ncbi:unnamed protein product [Bursaphelenchus xylophilus]|uniref:(pine wood nematode) hypothetical protein n=1 Tax=Bursaphelenchus xylophilus TaxID=6326 RepID=A0A1I7SX88_BURXY|nr:unnamed protein product [Bursaphelenchus xylophilus]CAG9100254.1 unnamed protein product [Bursaphelenchus xylophilus]
MDFWTVVGTASSVASAVLSHSTGRRTPGRIQYNVVQRIPCAECQQRQQDLVDQYLASDSSSLRRAPLCDECRERARVMFQPGRLQTGWMSGQELLPYLEIGDLIEFHRQAPVTYCHWAVYTGLDDGIKVVCHFANEGDDIASGKGELKGKLLSGSSDAHVRVDPFLNVAGDSLVRINNILDNEFTPFPPMIVKERCEHKMGNRGYNLIFNNCEQFAKWSRYGCADSDQSNKVVSVIIGGTALCMGASVGGALAVGGLVYTGIRAARTALNNMEDRNII